MSQETTIVLNFIENPIFLGILYWPWIASSHNSMQFALGITDALHFQRKPNFIYSAQYCRKQQLPWAQSSILNISSMAYMKHNFPELNLIENPIFEGLEVCAQGICINNETWVVISSHRNCCVGWACLLFSRPSNLSSETFCGNFHGVFIFSLGGAGVQTINLEKGP